MGDAGDVDGGRSWLLVKQWVVVRFEEQVVQIYVVRSSFAAQVVSQHRSVKDCGDPSGFANAPSTPSYPPVVPIDGQTLM